MQMTGQLNWTIQELS